MFVMTEQHIVIWHVSRLMEIPSYFLTGKLIHSLIQPTLWFIWHTHMHNSLSHRSHSPSNPQEEFLLKIRKLRDLYTFYTSRKFTLFAQHNNTSLKIERKRKKPLTSWMSDLFKLHFYLVPCSLQRTFYQFSYLLPLKILDWKQCHKMLNKYKLLLQRCKNRPERKASFLFNILETIADNLRAAIEFTPI